MAPVGHTPQLDRAPDSLADGTPEVLRDELVALLGPDRVSPLPTIEVEGGADEVLRLPDEDGRTVSVLPLALATVLEEDVGLFDFQLVQHEPSRLELRSGLRTASARPAMHRARSLLERFLARHGACGTSIECHPGEPMVAGRSGKIPRIVAETALRRQTRRGLR